MKVIQTILHPTDGSQPAYHAFRLACSLARDHEARLVVLHVLSDAHPFISEVFVAPALGTTDSLTWSEELRERMEKNCPDVKMLPVEYVVKKGDPVEVILRVADECNAGLIVVGTHGRSGIDRVLMGSVAETIVRKAPCSVLAVKMPRVKTAAHENSEIRHAETST